MKRHEGRAGGPIHLHVGDHRLPASDMDYGEPLMWAEDPEARPYLDSQGHLVLPMNCPMKWRWWQGGQGAGQTRRELSGAA